MSDTSQLPVDRLRTAQAARDLDAVAIQCDALQQRIIDAADSTTAKPAGEAAGILRDLARNLRSVATDVDSSRVTPATQNEVPRRRSNGPGRGPHHEGMETWQL